MSLPCALKTPLAKSRLPEQSHGRPAGNVISLLDSYRRRIAGCRTWWPNRSKTYWLCNRPRRTTDGARRSPKVGDRRGLPPSYTEPVPLFWLTYRHHDGRAAGVVAPVEAAPLLGGIGALVRRGSYLCSLLLSSAGRYSAANSPSAVRIPSAIRRARASSVESVRSGNVSHAKRMKASKSC
jgi:hypothetical protein